MDALDYNEHLQRAAFLLQDCLTFIWSGAAVKLAHPKLFLRYKIRESVFTYGRLYLSPQLVAFPHDFALVRCSLPVDEFAQLEEEDADEDDDDLALALPTKFIYALFPQHGNDREKLRDIVGRIRLCLRPCGGIIIPSDKSISGTIAANLLNGLFSALCTAAGLPLGQQRQFVDAMREGRNALHDLLSAHHPNCLVSY